ncbi:MAG: hypothetical protein MJE68_15425 [Proteobacteria bacterium]|nr:hypothetical protein [Pseudomonadota bacterium]
MEVGIQICRDRSPSRKLHVSRSHRICVVQFSEWDDIAPLAWPTLTVTRPR